MTASPHLLSFLLATASCTDPIEPCYGTKAGRDYDIELLERWDDDSSYDRNTGSPYPYETGCGPDLDIWEGDRIRIAVEGHEYHHAAACRNAVFRPVAPEQHGWEILSSRPQAASVVFVGQFEARIGDCEGLLQMVVDEEAQAPNLYSAPVPGEQPNFVLERLFRSNNCPTASCSDAFVVQIHPVE
jgi:hypothetical protein